MSRLTMNEIARMAGVSKATVSRAVHTPHLVRPDTRARILRIMDEQQYIYHTQAAELSTKRSSMIGLVIPTVKSSIHAEVIDGMHQEMRAAGYALIIGYCEYNLRTELDLISLFRQRRLAGIVLTGIKPGTEEVVLASMAAGTPCVIIWETTDDGRFSYVGFDNREAAFKVTDYLAGLGHRRIGMIMGPYSKARRVRERLQGYRMALEKHGIPFDEGLTVEKEPTLVDGKEAMNRLLSLEPRLTAVFAASDVLAMGALSAIKERGLRVPEDISLAGFDDIDFASFCDPPLTTVRIPAFEMGRVAVKTVLEMLEKGPGHVRQYCLNTDLVVRKSCRPPRS